MAFSSTRRLADSAARFRMISFPLAGWLLRNEGAAPPCVCAALTFDERHLAERHARRWARRSCPRGRERSEVGSAARSSHAPRAVTLFAAATNSVRRFPVNLERSSCELVFKEMEMNVKTVSGASMAAAAIALVLSGAAPAPALAEKNEQVCPLRRNQFVQGNQRLQDREQRLQGHELMQGSGVGARKISSGLRGEGRQGRRDVSQAARTDALSSSVPRRFSISGASVSDDPLEKRPSTRRAWSNAGAPGRTARRFPVSRTTEPNCQMQTDTAASCLKDKRNAAAAKAVDASAASPIVTNGAMGAPRLTIDRINTAAGMLMARMAGRQ